MVRQLREKHGLSQEDLALAARVQQRLFVQAGARAGPTVGCRAATVGRALAVPLADLYTAAGLGHLLAAREPDLDPALELYVHQIDSLPQQDRAIIIGVLQTILAEERAHAATVAPPPDQEHQTPDHSRSTQHALRADH